MDELVKYATFARNNGWLDEEKIAPTKQMKIFVSWQLREVIENAHKFSYGSTQAM